MGELEGGKEKVGGRGVDEIGVFWEAYQVSSGGQAASNLRSRVLAGRMTCFVPRGSEGDHPMWGQSMGEGRGEILLIGGGGVDRGRLLGRR